MIIQSCNYGCPNFCQAPSCLIEEVKNLPKLNYADCNRIYRDRNNDLWVVTEDGWQQLLSTSATKKERVAPMSTNLDVSSSLVESRELGYVENGISIQEDGLFSPKLDDKVQENTLDIEEIKKNVANLSQENEKLKKQVKELNDYFLSFKGESE